MFLVCGEALFDVFVGEGANPATFEMNARAGGSPFNVAIGLSRLQQPSALLTGISQDELGHRLMRMLEAEKVDTSYLVRTGRRTTVVMINLDDAGTPNYVFYGVGSADCGVTMEELPAIRQDITGLHFGSYSMVVRPVADAFASMLDNLSDKFISVDPNVRLTIEPDVEIWRARFWQYAQYADMFKISAEDIDALYPGRSHQTLAEALIKTGVQFITITDGAQQVKCWTANGLTAAMQPDMTEVVDTVGAGDTFQSALLAKLLQWGNSKQRIRELTQSDLNELLDFAVKAASITCSRQGADLPYLHEISEVGSENDKAG
jgi:fructokinase